MEACIQMKMCGCGCCGVYQPNVLVSGSGPGWRVLLGCDVILRCEPIPLLLSMCGGGREAAGGVVSVLDICHSSGLGYWVSSGVAVDKAESGCARGHDVGLAAPICLPSEHLSWLQLLPSRRLHPSLSRVVQLSSTCPQGWRSSSGPRAQTPAPACPSSDAG